jgi:hypothetical protein
VQHTLIQLEYAKASVADRNAVKAPGVPRISHPPPRPSRRRLAEILARVAWRLDREAALRAWP